MFFPAGRDLYGSQPFGSSFIFEPLQCGFGNLFSTYESFHPPSNPAAEVRVIPASHFYIKSMVFAANRLPTLTTRQVSCHNFTAMLLIP
jgi:porin